MSKMLSSPNELLLKVTATLVFEAERLAVPDIEVEDITACLGDSTKNRSSSSSPPSNWISRDPETNSEFTPENEWLEDFLVSFWDDLFAGANC